MSRHGAGSLMASLYTHAFSHQVAFRRTFLHHSLKRASHPLGNLKASATISPLRARPFSDHVTSGRVITTTAGVGTGLAGAGLGLSFYYANLRGLNCEQDADAGSKEAAEGLGRSDRTAVPPPPESIVNMHELTFGTVSGVCAGVFVKKGAKTLAWFFGGIFVLLQYLGATSIIKVDWTRAAARFEGLFYRIDIDGTRRPPNVYSLCRRLVDFLTADFQPRASFIVGFALGLRIG
ncbi:FUN14 family-domain-containing protein [Russula earlei]|uniref:FUN14 family-domain-containing protein n=1 Tax=Russula earlei TaxID=71964 RepID=A0ACC0UGK6_9AGAM|nr:FUN14 family-domain-containing protein [Russula earlei]